MTKKNNASSARRKLIPAVGMLVVSAMMLSSSTYAWFSMSKDVSVTGMQIKATAEDGLVISDYTKTNWATSWNVNMNGTVALAPVSTDGSTTPAWTTAKSKNFDNADKNQATGDYTDIASFTFTKPQNNNADDGAWDTGEGIGKSNDVSYVLLKNFYIKSTGNEAWQVKPVVDEVTATPVLSEGATSQSALLNKALRVLVIISSSDGTKKDSFIYAPVEQYDNDCKFKGTTSLTLKNSTSDSTCTNVDSIPTTNDGAVNVKMYMYFEGEDQNCKSSNIAGISVDNLKVSAKFKTSAGPADPNQNQNQDPQG